MHIGNKFLFIYKIIIQYNFFYLTDINTELEK